MWVSELAHSNRVQALLIAGEEEVEMRTKVKDNGSSWRVRIIFDINLRE